MRRPVAKGEVSGNCVCARGALAARSVRVLCLLPRIHTLPEAFLPRLC